MSRKQEIQVREIPSLDWDGGYWWEGQNDFISLLDHSALLVVVHKRQKKWKSIIQKIRHIRAKIKKCKCLLNSLPITAPYSPPRWSQSFLYPLSFSLSPSLKSFTVEEKKKNWGQSFVCAFAIISIHKTSTGMKGELYVTCSAGECGWWSVRNPTGSRWCGRGLPWPERQGSVFWEPLPCY